MPAYLIPPWNGPLAPLVQIHVKWQGGREAVQALMDSGADFTQIPLRIVRALGLRQVRERQVRYGNGPPVILPVFSADIEFNG